MNFSRFQKFTSFFLLFFLCFSFTIRVPFLGLLTQQAQAEEQDFYSLVSVIVEESAYSDLKSEIERYAKDIQSTLENTRVVILPTPSDASSFQIASLNESLYFEGYNSLKSSDFESRLVGTVLVGDLSIPFVFDGSASNKTIVPYTDFLDKSYIYDHETGNYERNENQEDDFAAEIWHGVIHPNSGDKKNDIKLLKDYFDKNHDFYTGEGNFDSNKGIINGDIEDQISEDYKPYVFYYDQFRENSAVQYQKYQGYKAYLENIDDITYNRHSKELAETVRDQVLGGSSDDMRDLISTIDPDFPLEGFGDGPDVNNTPDVQTRHVTDASTKKFLEIFNSSALGEMRKFVYNAGRYNEGGRDVNIDMVPFLISALDEVNAQIVKNASYDIEKEIDAIIQNGLARDIAIPVDIQQSGSNSCSSTHTNFLYGMQAADITNAAECSIYRGSNAFSGTLVEANRGLNINNSQLDIQKNQDLRLLQQSAGFKTEDLCNGAGVLGYWGGNSPINLDTSGSDLLDLGAHDLKGGIQPVFDIAGAKEITDSSKVASPLDCFNNNYITTFRESWERDGLRRFCQTELSIPINGQGVVGWSCDSRNIKYNFSSSFDDLFLGTTPNICNGKSLYLDGTPVACNGATNSGGAQYSYKKISSHIKHVSPTPEEYAIQLTNQVSPSLPIDKKRYVDFISADGSYQKIDYPDLFTFEDDKENSFDIAEERIKSELDRISLQINTIKKDNNPNALSGRSKDLYNILSTGSFPSRDVDLYKMYQEKDLSVYGSNGDEKQISYSDTLAFSLYWNSLNTPSAKYKFIFENYLSDQFQSEGNYNLPKAKKSYEIAYFGAPGDSQNMYIKLDPEGKSDNEYASVISDNIKLDNYLLTSSIGTDFSLNLGEVASGDLDPKARFGAGSPQSPFACAPPDGVPIWEWIPAITCWMNDMLPPTISISEGHCGMTLLSDEEKDQYQECKGDVNKNGVSDCIEGTLSGGQLDLSSDSTGYSYNSPGSLTVNLQDKDGKIIKIDNASYVKFELTKVEIPLDNSKEFTSGNTKTVFDVSNSTLSTDEARQKASDYINFTDSEIRVSGGTAKANFSSKGKDVNIFFRTTLSTKDNKGDQIISLESSIREVQIRGDMFFTSSYKISESGELLIANNDVVVSDATNIYLIDTNQQNINAVVEDIKIDSNSKEKTILALSNVSKVGNALPLYYPLDVKIIKDDEIVFEQLGLSATDIGSFTALSAIQESGTYDISIINSKGMKSLKTLQILPDVATRLDVELSTTVNEVGGSITTHIFTILDRFGNPGTGSLYNVKANIFGNGLEFDAENKKSISLDTFEGYKAFRLKSTDNPGVNKITFDLFDPNGDKVVTTTKTVRTLKGIQLDVEAKDESIQVGGGIYEFDITLQDADNNVVTDFNSRAYLVLNSLYGYPDTPYVEIKDGRAKVMLRTNTLAGRDVKLEFQIEGLNEIYKKYIEILPDVPMKVDMALSKGKMEASKDASSLLEVSLKDRYDNLVFNDSTTKFDIELLEKYQDIISFDAGEKTAIDGKNQFKISGSETPGIARFKVSTSPSLGDNSFSLYGQSPFTKTKLDEIPGMRTNDILNDTGRLLFREYSDSQYISQFSDEGSLLANTTYLSLSVAQQTSILNLFKETTQLVISGVGENAGSIETFYFWNNENVIGNNYNALYSVLLGAPYGDVTQENYLASGLLFDKDNRAISVTSLLNDPYKRDDIVSIHPYGGLASLASTADITQDIDFLFDIDATGRLVADIANKALNTYVGKLYYNLGDDTDVSICEDANFTDCINKKQDSQVLMNLVDESYVLEKNKGGLLLKNEFGREVFAVDQNGAFSRKASVYIELNTKAQKDHLFLNLLSDDKIIAEISVVLNDGDINTNRGSNSLLKSKLASLKNTMILSLETNMYGTKDIYIDSDTTKKILFYNDPFSANGKLDDFHSEQENSFVNIAETSGLGWEQGNKALLGIASGKTLGDATQDYASFSLINLGDPVFAFKKIQKKFQTSDKKKHFDATIGKRISGNKDVDAYRVFDYNADGRDDIMFVGSDGYIELLENKYIETSFLGKGPLVFAADIGKEVFIKTGNFTGDGYDDIFFLNDKGQPFLFNNNLKDFVRFPLADIFDLDGSIVQVETYDMDNDTNTDIVTLDDSGQIHIFYGGGSDAVPSFTKLKVGDGYGVELNSDTMNSGAAVYFDGVPQIDNNQSGESLISSNEEYFAELGSNLALSPTANGVDEGLLDRLIFVTVPYAPVNNNLTPNESFVASLETGIPTTNNSTDNENVQGARDALTNFVNSNSDYIDYSDYSAPRNTDTTFVRSEYSENLGIKIEKTFTDKNQGLLQTGDLIEVEIKITNTTSNILRDIVYVDKLPKDFIFHSEEIKVEGIEDAETLKGPGSYDILLDDVTLSPGQVITLSYDVKTPPIRFGFLEVGDYEIGKVGADIYGDILLKDSEKNCGHEATVYNSTSERAYAKAGITPTCDPDKMDLPEGVADNAVDENENGVPDYIDALNSGSDAIVQDYMQDLFEEFNGDSDDDGIPDRDDIAPDINENDSNFMSSLSDFNNNIDEITSSIDNIIEGFGCGFGGGGCIATPLNWAPLAPGSDPVLFGKPIGDGLRVDEGLPIFSSLTGIQIPPTPTSPPICVPAVWPASPLGFVPGPQCGPKSAGGKLGTWAPTNTVRIFATPTLTGGFGIAVCFGGPAIVAGYSNPPGISPIAPGGNCIVAAVPIISCGEEDNGDPGSLGYPSYVNGSLGGSGGGGDGSIGDSSDGSYGVINGNCEPGSSHTDDQPKTLSSSAVSGYLDYKNGRTPYSEELEERLVEALSIVARDGGNYHFSGGPVIDLVGGGEGNSNIDVQFDLDSATAGDFADVVKVELNRVSPFPNFLMDWVTRQMEEVVNKLTDLPKIFVILPDLSGIFEDGWSTFNQDLKSSFEEGKQARLDASEAYNSRLETLQSQRNSLDCNATPLDCKVLDAEILSFKSSRNLGQGETISGIRSVYEFLGNVPLVAIEPETIEVNIPWIDPSDIDNTIFNWKNTLEEWKDEVKRAEESWSLGVACDAGDIDCQQQNDISQRAYVDANSLISSLERNINILEDYKRLPEKLNKLITIKQTRLEQVLCNVDAISGLLGGWIADNGERFKAWVELYVLIKAILKSWQLVIDVFVDYEAECHECKNERQDLIGGTFQLISAIIPKPPIIQFPKWPDIIIDLHNVRAGLVIYLPDFHLNPRPIVLPNLPALRLPDVPNASLTFPALAVLPSFTIPELPDLPTLPTVELPNLPPPPKIPKLFGAVEGVLNILKLVTKAMCILKTSPFVPEWRAGDQIAYITERSGYLSTDFIDLSFPQFSYPFVEAIKVTSYVNLEFETEFITEAVRNIAAPLDTFTNDIVNMFQINIADIDLEVLTPSDLDVNIDDTGDVDLGAMNMLESFLFSLVITSADRFQDLLVYIDENKDVAVTNSEFLSYVSENLASESITSDPRTDNLRKLWEQVGDMTYSQENALIEDLLKAKDAKFDTLKDILNTEALRTNDLQKQIKDLGAPSYIKQVALTEQTNLQAYNDRLSVHNIALVESAVKMARGGQDDEISTIESDGLDLLSRVNNGVNEFEKAVVSPHLNLLADHTPGHTSGTVNSCSADGSNGYSYTYEGIYILQDNHNYKLFDYTDELNGDEITTPIDVDSDGDNDLIYMADGQVYMKENLQKGANKTYLSSPALYVSIGDNKFLNGDIFIEAINGLNEISVSNGFINAEFDVPTLGNDIFSLEFFDRIDASIHQDNNQYIPESTKKYVIDAFADIDENTLKAKRDDIIMRQNLAYINYVGKLPGVTLTTPKLINIKDDVKNNIAVNLTATTRLYAGATPAFVKYTREGSDEIDDVNITKYSNIVFGEDVEIVGITGNAYIKSREIDTIKGQSILRHIGKPIFTETKIELDRDTENITESSHLDIIYYDGTKREIYFKDIYGYEIYDLGDRPSDTHVIRTNLPNDFYYAKVLSLQSNTTGTYSNQILFSPQIQADKNVPEIVFSKKIRIPVYQTRKIDMTEHIYEDGGIRNIADIWIDFDLGIDSDNDGNALNDRDTDKITIDKTLTNIDITFGEYEELFTKKIRISVEDNNGNIGQRDIDFEVYAPEPRIDTYDQGIVGGSLDEDLIGEPVRIYRSRGGAIEKLQEKSGEDKILSVLEGNYDFETPQTSSGLVLMRDNIEVATINEYTGKIILTDLQSNVIVLPSNADDNTIGLPKLSLLYRGGEIFHEYISIIETIDIGVINQFTSDLTNGLYLRFIDSENYGYYKVPLGVPYNPGAVVIHRIEDSEKTPLFTLFRDGRIDTLDSRFELRYNSFEDSVVFDLHDTTTNKTVGEVLIKVDANYVLK